ncbi:MAG: UDP-N-acetylmuramoyl-tripeptide--D-alanyl-D-alanine ligase [Gemmatimonadales bacterium]
MSGDREGVAPPPWAESAVRQALGLMPAEAHPPVTFSGIFTDSRTLQRDGLFIALKGDRFDGHDHLSSAAAAGATAAVVRQGTPALPGLTLFHVDDTLRAFGLLARYRRLSLEGPVVAVTGTNGKTSTKEMLRAVLGTRYRTHATRANLNNLVGVPLTILEAPEDTEALIIEAGANLPGEISRYREIIEPTITLVTNAVQGHLEGFGTLAGVVDEKLALTEGVPLAIVGPEPPGLREGARKRAREVRSAGLRGADLMPDRVVLDNAARPILTIGGTTFTLAARGLHQADNAVRVWAVIEALDLDRERAAQALERFTIPGGRGELIQEGSLTILNDSYNANPQSFRATIATAAALRADRRLVFVAGTMRELGQEAPALHQEIAEALVDLHPELLAAVGEFVPALAPYAGALRHRLVTAADPLALAPLLAERLRGDELVVLKASRGVALERILPALKARAKHTPAPGAPLHPR